MNSFIRIIVKFGLCFLLLILCISYGCQKLEETYAEFKNIPEVNYVGKADSVFYVSGIEKVRLFIAYNSDPKIVGGVIKNADESITKEFQAASSATGRDTVVVDMDLPEGSYRLFVNMLDPQGNPSLTTEILVDVLGESYQNILVSREITGVQARIGEESNITARISLGKSYDNIAFQRLEYTDIDNMLKTVESSRFETEIDVDDFLPGSEFRLVTVYNPINPFVEFTEGDTIGGVMPSCNKANSVSVSIDSLFFGELESDMMSTQSLTLNGFENCTIYPVKFEVAEPFLLGKSEDGAFAQSISIDSIEEASQLFIRFFPQSNVTTDYKVSIQVSSPNIVSSQLLTAVGREIGSGSIGPYKHPVEMRSSASDIFTDDLDVFQHNTSIDNLWDNDFVWPSAIHSAGNLPIPIGFFTVDLGQNYALREVLWMARHNCCPDRSNKKYQYWGLPDHIDPADAITTTEFNGVPENKEAWEDEMLSKGWVHLGDFETTREESDESISSSEHIKNSITVKNRVRYVRMVIEETFQANNVGTINFSELDFIVED